MQDKDFSMSRLIVILRDCWPREEKEGTGRVLRFEVEDTMRRLPIIRKSRTAGSSRSCNRK